MNAPFPSSSRRLAPPTDTTSSAVHAPALVAVARGAPAANADAVTVVSNHAVNPLWMITVGLAIFFGAMAMLVSTS